MKNQNFYLRFIALLLILMAVFFYNGTIKDKEHEESIAQLSAKVENMQTQQEEILTALEETYEEQKAASRAALESSSNKTATEEEQETEDEADAEYFYQNGTFEGSGTGYGGTITVQVTLKEDTITDVAVVSAPGEDSAYLAQAESVINNILNEQSTDVDTISGATFSSTGILEAVNQALAKAENP